MPHPKPLLLILGATGLQGSAVLAHFHTHEPAYRIRGTTRNPSSPAALALKQSHPHLDLVAADANDPSSLRAAFAGASVIFAYTDFAGCLQHVLQSGEAAEGGGDMARAAARLEVRQGMNIGAAAAGVAGLERLVWSGLPDVKGTSAGKYVGAVQFDSKVEVWRYMKGLAGLEGKVSAVVMGTFADNAVRLGQIFQIVKESEGRYVYHNALAGDTVVPYIDVKRDAGAFVSALIRAPSGLQVLAVSEPLSSKEWLALWARENGVEARYEETPIEVAKDDKVGMGEALSQVLGFIDEFGYTGGDPEILSPDDFEAKTGVKIPRTRIVEHIRGEDWSKLL